MRAAWSLAFAVVLGSGCFRDFDEPFSGSSDGGGGRGEGAGGAPLAGGSSTGGDGPGECDGTCIAHPGEEWEGPLSLYLGTVDGAPTCRDGTPAVVDLGSTITVPNATCNDNCDCGAPQGGTCGAAAFTVYDSLSCQGTALMVINSVDELCHNQEIVANNGDSVRATAATATGTCNPQGLQPDIPDASLSGRGLACEIGGSGTCGNGSVCAASAPAPFVEAVCFGQAGDRECPAALPDKHLLYASVVDERVCAPCECGAATNRNCDGRIELHGYVDCNGPQTNLQLEAQCGEANDEYTPSSYRFELDPPQGGSCEPSGGTVTGDVETTGDYTLCCSGSSG